MSNDNLALLPDGLRSWNRAHLILGLILLLLLFLLPMLFGIGPNNWTRCAAGVAAAVQAPAAMPAAAPAAEPAQPAAAAPKAVVYFDTGKFDIGDKGRADLKALVAGAAAAAKFAISGYHDAKGDPAKNAELAKQRAFAVRDVLKDAGVAEDRIEMRKPEVTSGAADAGIAPDAEARRVEVSVLN